MGVGMAADFAAERRSARQQLAGAVVQSIADDEKGRAAIDGFQLIQQLGGYGCIRPVVEGKSDIFLRRILGRKARFLRGTQIFGGSMLLRHA